MANDALVEFYQFVAALFIVAPVILVIVASPFVVAWSYLTPRRLSS